MTRIGSFAGAAISIVFFTLAPPSRAAMISWDVTPAQSSVTLVFPDQAVTVGPLTGTVGIRNQNGTAWTTNGAPMDGFMNTNYVDGASIEFLSGSTLVGLNFGNFRPNPVAWNGTTYGTDTSTAPAVFGGNVRTTSPVALSLGFFSMANVHYDLTGGPRSISLGQFDATGLALQYLSDLYVDGLTTPFGQLVTDFNGPLTISATNSATVPFGVVISPDPIGDPTLRQLVVVIHSPVTASFSGITLAGNVTGQIVALAHVPEPGTFALAAFTLPLSFLACWRGRQGRRSV